MHTATSQLEADIETESVTSDGAPPVPPAQAAVSAARLDDLAQIIRSYTEVTDKLQRSHEALNDEVARLQRELSGANAQLQRSRRLAALGEMAAGIAHEIRNPLAAIQLYAGMLTQDLAAMVEAVDPDTSARDVGPQLEIAEKISVAVRGLDAIVGDVLSFSRELKPRLLDVEIGALFDRALDAHRPAIQLAGVQVRRLDLERGDDLAAPLDAPMLVQSLLNLIRNAVDAMATLPLGKPRVLTLNACMEDSFIVLAVRDSGPGIAEVDIDRIFNPFFTTRSTGTGLGLAIVHRIIDAHGGTITAYNDGGAVFEIRVPCSSEKGATDSAASPRAESSVRITIDASLRDRTSKSHGLLRSPSLASLSVAPAEASPDSDQPFPFPKDACLGSSA